MANYFGMQSDVLGKLFDAAVSAIAQPPQPNMGANNRVNQLRIRSTSVRVIFDASRRTFFHRRPGKNNGIRSVFKIDNYSPLFHSNAFDKLFDGFRGSTKLALNMSAVAHSADYLF